MTTLDVAVEPVLERQTHFRFATAGSVDDGKSTLVGRLLHDTASVLADQFAAVERVSRAKGFGGSAGGVDLALLTDGLRAEREQGITIDVAYRYFATGRRSFVLADCPGHVQYTRNTVTGASTADAVVVLVDVRTGVLEQTRRHLAVCALLRVPHVVVALNKIDLVGFDRDRVEAVTAEVADLASRLGLRDVTTVPVSALDGDNVVHRSPRTPWYDGPTLLQLLETLEPAHVGGERRDLRFPVQLVLRPQAAALDGVDADYRGYAGQIASGAVRPGDEVVVLPSGRTTSVAGIDTPDGELSVASAGQSVVLRLTDDVDVSRGDLIAARAGAPDPLRDLGATVCVLTDRPLRARDRLLVKHGTATVTAMVTEVTGRVDLDELASVPADSLGLNDIGHVRLRLASPLPVEPYTVDRAGGAFLVIDPQDGATLAAGMVGDPLLDPATGGAYTI